MRRSIWRKRPQPRQRPLRAKNAASFGVGYLIGYNTFWSGASTPDHADYDTLTGDLQVTFGVAFNHTTGKATIDNIITKGDPSSAGVGSFVVRKVASVRNIQFSWRESGGTVRSLTFANAVPNVIGAFRWYTLEFTASTATGDLYTSDELPATTVESITWSFHSSDTDSVATDIATGSADIWVGNRADNPDEWLDGNLYYANIRDGINGDKVLEADFRYRELMGVNNYQLIDPLSRTWSVSIPAVWALPFYGTAPPRPIGKATNLLWDQRFALGDTATLRWDINAAIGDTSTLRWDVFQVTPPLIGYVQLMGTNQSYVTTPDHASLDLVGDLDLRADLTMANWASNKKFICKLDATSGYEFMTNLDTGQLRIAWRDNATNVHFPNSTAALPAVTGQRMQVRATLDIDNGSSQHVATFYYRTDLSKDITDNSGWTQLGDPVVVGGVTTVAAGGAQMALGAGVDGTTHQVLGKFYQAAVLDGINGTVVANPDFRDDDQVTTPNTVFTDPLGRVWTLNGSSVWAVPGGGITLLWDQRHVLDNSVGLLWDIRAAVGDPIQFLWDVHAPISDESALRWDIFTSAGDQFQALWDIHTALGDQVQFLWDQRAAVGDAVQALWDLRAAQGDSIQALWDIFRVAPIAVSPSFRAIGNYANAATSVTVQIPVGTAVDDILLLLVETANQAVTVSNPNGGTWTEAPDSPQGIGPVGVAGGVRLTVFWSRYNGTQGDPTISDSGDHQTAVIMAIPGCVKNGSPVHVSAGATQASGSSTLTLPGDITTVDKCFIVAMTATDQDLVTSDNLSGWTNADLDSIDERVDRSFAGASGGGLGAATGTKSIAGAFGSTTVTQGGGGAAAAFLTLALLPQPAGQVSFPWDIRAPAGNTTTLRWDISGAVGKQFQALWDIYTALGDAVELQWDVLEAQAIGDEVQLLWDLHTTVADTVQFLWDISGAVGDQVALQWDVRTPVGDQIALLWDLIANLGDTASLQWDVHMTIGDTIALLWDILRDYVYLRPVATVSNDGWDSGPTTGLPLWQQLDETVADDADYITNAV